MSGGGSTEPFQRAEVPAFAGAGAEMREAA
jgi:hypothetical protein